MHSPNTYTSNSYRESAAPGGHTGTLVHGPLSLSRSNDSGVPVWKNSDFGTGTPEHRACAGLFVSTSLASWQTDQPERFARDVQIDDTAYRRLDPEYYAWLRSKMNLARMAAKAGQLGQDAYDALRGRFNAVHEWAMGHVGELALAEAVRSLDARDYRPPVAEPDAPAAAAGKPNSIAQAVEAVDSIAEKALALGWERELLYGVRCSPLAVRSGLVSYLKPGDRIGEVTRQSIEIILGGPSQVRQRFYNPDVDQAWIRRVQ